MEWLKEGALPMGIVFMAFTVFGVLRRKAGHGLAARDYPALAARLGLAYRPSRYRTGVGTLSGLLGGLKVIVDPDEQRLIRVRYPEDVPMPRVELHTYEHNKKLPEDLRPLRIADRRLQGWFRTCYAAPAEAEILARELPALAGLRSIRQLKTLSITPSGLTGHFDYGSPPFIPAAIVSEVVPLLCALASSLLDAQAMRSEPPASSSYPPPNFEKTQ